MSENLNENKATEPAIRTKRAVELADEEDIVSIQQLIKTLEKHDAEPTGEVEYSEDYKTNAETFSITLIEFAIINEFLFESYRKTNKDIVVSNYGSTDTVGRINLGGPYNMTNPWWFHVKFNDEPDNEFIIQTKTYLDNRHDLITELHVTVKNGVSVDYLYDTVTKIKKLAFNNSRYVGKCIKVRLNENNFKGIEIIDISNFTTELILNDTQRKFIEHFISRVRRGGTARYLLNGEPGTGKTESIREIIRKLTPNVTFVIPDFSTTDDLTVILEACEIFNNVVIIMDDIDLFLGSRDKGSYTMLLGQFLSFFDGVKKRKISLLASTNDKGLVDKAAERPGRFNMTLDYTFLMDEQIIKVCEIHLPKEYQIQEVYDALTGTINGKKAKITGAFIANLAENIKEMAEDEGNWTIDDAISLIKESYKGFYMSQVDKNGSIGFKTT